MSLVGTRPILPDELEQYELHHRARIAIKPGITGMWQVSGRSDITDFEEIVRLDTEYISQWNICDFSGVRINDVSRVTGPVNFNLFTWFSRDMHGSPAFFFILLDFCRNRDSLKNGTLISIRRTGDGFHPGLFKKRLIYSERSSQTS